MTSIAAGGATLFQGASNKALKSATINGNASNLPFSESFYGNANLNTGNNNVPVAITDGANNTKTNNYQVSVNTGSSATLTFDANGNMTGCLASTLFACRDSLNFPLDIPVISAQYIQRQETHT